MRESAENAISAHDQWIGYETPRSEGSAQTNICFEAFLFVNQKTGSCKISRLRPEQTIEWDNLVRAREVRVRNRTIFPFRFLSVKHAHYNSSPHICSFDCLHWSESVDFAATGVWFTEKMNVKTNIRCECASLSNVDLWVSRRWMFHIRFSPFDCSLSAEMDDEA